MLARIISASAGTGKTYTMAIEYIRALNKGVKFDDILVITFTKKATAEIKERIIDFLDKIVNKKDGYEDIVKSLDIKIDYNLLKNVYKDILLNQENLKIMTNDALINNIFKTSIAPYKNMYGYEIIEENDETFIANILNRLIKENLNDFEALYKLSSFKKIEDSYNTIKTILKSRMKVYELINNKSPLLEDKKYDFNLLKEDIVKYLFDYKEIDFIKPIGKGPKNLSSIEMIFSIKEEIEKIKNIADVTKLVKYFDDFKSAYIKNYYQGDNKAIAKEINEKIANDFKLRIAKQYLQDEVFEYNRIYRRIAKLCFDIEDEIKFYEKKLTFSDITFYTNKYLYEKELNLVDNGIATDKFLELLGGKFNTLMIDEFQDTDAVQLKLFMPIIRTCENVLIVGDEKQAIYGFRGANSRLFKNLDKILKENIEDIVIEKKVLDTCYRTRDDIINYINTKFTELPDFSYENVLSKKEGGFVKVISSKEYTDIVNEIKNSKSSSSAVLLRTNTEIDDLAKVLEQNNILYNSIKSMNLSKDKNVIAIKLLIDYLVTNDAYKLLEFLRSDLIAMPLNDVKKFMDDRLENNEIMENISKLKLDSSDFKRKYLSYFPFNENMTNTDILNINKFLDIVEKSTDIREFYHKYKEIMANIKQENATNAKSVNLLTIHKSKGLEYDDIHVLYKAKKEDFKDYTMVSKYNEKDELEDFYYLKKRKIVELTEFGQEYFEIFEKNELEETYNLMYVALTRPKDNLYIYYDDKNNFMRFTEEIFGTKIKKEIEEEKTEDLVFNNKDYYNKTNFKEHKKNTMVNSIEDELNRKLGLAIHYYMQNFETLNDFDFAKSMALKKYGNLIGPVKMKEVISRCEKFVNENKEMFSSEFEVHNEYKISDGKFVIDRLNIDRENKVAYIYDYKTKKNPEKIKEYVEQVENYKSILKEELDGYEIKTKLLNI